MARLSASPIPSYPSRSISPSPSFSTPSFVEHAADDETSSEEEEQLNFPGRSPVPVHSDDERVDGLVGGERDKNNGEGVGEEETVVCLWEDCGRQFTHLPTLIDHIHSDHIGVHKSNYTCEWSTCTRRGLSQTSRFALISHIRSHTGEKPFTCPRPECDKSFTRSDALAKHMRLQHNISPPLPGRGGNRKRKRSDATSHPPDMGVIDPSNSASGFTTFKVESVAQTPFDLHQPYDDVPAFAEGGGGGGDYFSQPPLQQPPPHLHPHSQTRQRSRSPSDDEEVIPPQLMEALDPQSGLILGRSPSMVRYLITKAKHRFVLEQHECLIEQLRVLRAEERRERTQKDLLMDRVLRANFGPPAEQFVAYASGSSSSGRHRTTHAWDDYYTER